MNERKKSGIIIIGDEVLSGKTLDTNSNFISSHLIKRGVDVKEISIKQNIFKRTMFSSLYGNRCY